MKTAATVSGTLTSNTIAVLAVLLSVIVSTNAKGPTSAMGASPEPEFVEPLHNVTVTAGRDIKLHCSVKHLGSYKVAWIYVERSAILTVQSHVITRNPRISVTHDQHHTWTLHIASVHESDRGGYMCQINTAVAKTRIGFINVLVPPSINDALSSSDVTAREQSPVTLTCNATGTRPLHVRWRREDGKLIALNRTHAVAEVEGSVLELNKVNRFDMAAYLCIASNGVPPIVSKRITLTVEFAPSVTLQQQLIGAPIGSSVSLDCGVESSPAALHFWTRADAGGQQHAVIHDRAGKYVMQSTAIGGPSTVSAWPSFRAQLRLTIVNVTAKDYGAYRCVAKNPFGEADGVITFHHTPAISTTVPYQRRTPPVAVVSSGGQEANQNESNQTHMKLAGPTTGKARETGENTLPANDSKEGLGKSTTTNGNKNRPDSKWTFSWNSNGDNSPSSAGSTKLDAKSIATGMALVVVFLHRIGHYSFDYSPTRTALKM